MHRRVLAFLFTFLILASIAHAAPASDGARDGRDGGISQMEALVDSFTQMLAKALAGDAEATENRPSSPQADSPSDGGRPDEPTTQFGGGPEPSG